MKTSVTTVGFHKMDKSEMVRAMARNPKFTVDHDGELMYERHTVATFNLLDSWGLGTHMWDGVDKDAAAAVRYIGFFGRWRLRKLVLRRMVEEFANAER